ncbi:MAG: YhcH/YjgK/YiaL family protein [Candidatus Omnitrophota bacterium]
MILDKLVNAERYYNLHAGFKNAFEFLSRHDIADLPDAKYEIDGKRIYATVFEGQGKGRKASKLEAHNKYIDIHYAISGFDEIGWNPVQECAVKDGGYDGKKDFQLYSDVPKIWIPHAPGTFIVFFPEDAHAPITIAKDLHKVVVKVAVKW